MAKKPARSPMAVDKSQTPAWMKAVIIVLAVSFGLGGVAVVAAGIGGSDSNASAPASDDITSAYQPRVDAALAAAESAPDNPDILIQVGHAYYDWAIALYENGQQEAAVPMWLAAVSYYDKTLALDPGNDIALGNKAFALYYAQDDGALPALEAFVASAADNAQLAEQVKNAQSMIAEMRSTAATPTTAP